MPEPKYVALQALRFGDRDLQPGEPVPHEAGRSYHQMVSLGQIGPAPKTGGAPAVTPGSRVAFVDAQGEVAWVVYQGAELPDEVSRLALELEPGEPAALVKFPGEGEVLVASDSLLPEQPTDRLLTRAETEARQQSEALDTANQLAAQREREAADLREQVQYLQLRLVAVRTPGEPLSPDQPGGRELVAAGITTREGLQLLAQGERGTQNLLRVEGIGAKTAAKILDGLAPPAATTPDPAAAPGSPPGS